MPGGQVLSGSGNALNVTGPDDFYLILQQGGGFQIPQASTAVCGVVGSAPWGPTNTVVTIGSPADVSSNFGPSMNATYDLSTDLLNAISGGVNTLRAVRVTDGTDVAAVFKIADSTGFATNTLTISGTFSTSSILNVTLTPVTGAAVVVAYQVVAGDTNNPGAAQSFANAINATSAVLGPNAFIQKVGVASNIITLTALVQGAGSNAIAQVSSVTGGTMTDVSGAATFAGGAAPGTIATLTARYTGSLANTAQIRVDTGSQSVSTSPTYKLSIAFPNAAAPEVYDNIIAYATVGAGFSGSTFQTNIVNAVNSTPQLSASRPQSAYFIATTGASVIAPVTATVFAVSTSGTDGSTFGAGATFAQLGNDAATPKTGMYALSGQISGGQFWLAGNTDYANAWNAQIAFAVRENAAVFLSFPTGTSTATAIANKQAGGYSSPNAIIFKDFSEFTDTVNNIFARRVPSLAFPGAKNAIQSPETSPANQRLNSVITGTERYSSIAGVQPSIYTPTEIGQLEAAGINLITNTGPGVNAFCIRHNKNSLGQADPRGGIAYTNMTKFVAASLSQALFGQFVGLAQSTAANDPVRMKVRNALNNFVVNLINQGLLDPASKDGVVCDLRNNPKSQIALGILRFDLTLTYLAVIDKVIGMFSGSQLNTIKIVPVGVTANS